MAACVVVSTLASVIVSLEWYIDVYTLFFYVTFVEFLNKLSISDENLYISVLYGVPT